MAVAKEQTDPATKEPNDSETASTKGSKELQAPPSGTPTPPQTSLTNRISNSLYNAFLFCACTANVPMFSLVFCNAIYWTALYKSTRTEALAANPWIARTLGLYLAYSLADPTPQRGMKVSIKTREWLRRWPFFVWTARYFPVSLHKTYDLDDTERPFLFLYHPHGVIGMGTNCAINTNGCNFDKVFPNIRHNRWGVTLNVVFLCAPFYREWILLMGFISANKATLAAKLKDGDSVVLVPGGAAEALHAHESNFCLHLAKRRGFVRLAMETDAALVPVLGFGENRAFATYHAAGAAAKIAAVKQEAAKDSTASWVFRVQQRLCKAFSFSTPIMTWPFPLQRPIDVVVGAPVIMDSDNVEECFAKYTAALQELYEKHKVEYGYGNVPLEII